MKKILFALILFALTASAGHAQFFSNSFLHHIYMFTEDPGDTLHVHGNLMVDGKIISSDTGTSKISGLVVGKSGLEVAGGSLSVTDSNGNNLINTIPGIVIINGNLNISDSSGLGGDLSVIDINGINVKADDSVTGTTGSFDNLYCDTLHYSVLDPAVSGGSFDSTSCQNSVKTKVLKGCSGLRIESSNLRFSLDSLIYGDLFYFNKTSNNTFLGIGSGGGHYGTVTTGTGNCFFGPYTGNYAVWGAPTNNAAGGYGAMRYIGASASANSGWGPNCLANVRGYYNDATGAGSGQSVEDGNYNTLHGPNCAIQVRNGNRNIMLGYMTGTDPLYSGGKDCSDAIYIGTYAGAYQKHDKRFIISMFGHYSEGDSIGQVKDSLDSFMYGIMDPSSSASHLRLNSNVNIKHSFTAESTVTFKNLSGSTERILTIDANGVVGSMPFNNSETPSPSIYSIKADTGITSNMITYRVIRISGSGGAVDISANPQIVAGSDGQIIKLVGTSDANTVKFDAGNGLRLNSGTSKTLGEADILVLQYFTSFNAWCEVSYSNN